MFTYYSLMFFIACIFKGPVHDIVFAGRVKIVSHSSCRTSTILKYFCPLRSHTFLEIDHKRISTVIFLLSADSFKKGCCQLQVKVFAQITG